MIATGDRILRIPWLLLGIAGALAGCLIFLSPFVVPALLSPGPASYKGWHWSLLRSWPSFAAGIGASGVLLYRWLLSRAVQRMKRELITD